jgi:SAM-dependent methyltransferase
MAARIDDIDLIKRDYTDSSRLDERFKAWREYHEPDMLAIIEEAVRVGSPGTILEVGCGDGRFSERLRDSLGARVVAMDLSPGMAARAALRGLDVQIGDIQNMPWPDETFDAVVANWMLYHVPDLDLGLQEVIRVLAPGGRLFASTMGRMHMRELWDHVGDAEASAAPELAFSSDNGAEILARHFDEVQTRPMHGHATFPSYQAARTHIESSLTRAHLAGNLPHFDGPLRVTTTNVLFVATKH